MKNKLIENYLLFRDFYHLANRRTVFLAVFSVFAGFLQFGAELALAASLQSLFFVMGLMGEKPQFLGDLIPYDNRNLILFGFLVIGSTRFLLGWLQAYVTGIVSVNCESEIRARIISYSLKNRKTASSEVADLFNDKAIGASNYISSVLNAFIRLTMSGLVLVSLFGISVKMTIATLATLAFLFIPVRLLNKRIRRHSDSLHKDIAVTLGRLLTGIRNSLLLHIYGTEAEETAKTTTSLRRYQRAYSSYYIMSGLKGIMPALSGIWLIALIAHLAFTHITIESGMLVSYLYLFLRFVTTLGELANLGSYLSLTRPRAMVIQKWWQQNKIREPEAQIEQAEKENESAPGFAKDIFARPTGWKLSDVSLQYNSLDAPVLSNFNLRLEPGKVLALIGKSGSGKSSVLSLLLGLNQPTSGRVEILDDRGAVYPLSRLRHQMLENVGYVGPESFLISGTIRENLVYGIDQYGDDELILALRMAECHFVFEMAYGLDHPVTEQGEGLSAGQKQRLSLARALVRQPKLLILDEATANLDDSTEQRLINTFAELKGRMTICIVTHKKSMLGIADEVLHLQNS